MTAIEGALRVNAREGTGRLMWLGAALLALGVGALIFPLISTLLLTLFAAWVMIFSGAAMLLGAFAIRGAGPFFGALLLALLSLAAGVFVLARPFTGELVITLTLGLLFMIQGAFEIVLAFELRPLRGWNWLLASAFASVLLSIVIVAGWPGTSRVALGVITGVNFISSGIAYLFLGGLARREGRF